MDQHTNLVQGSAEWLAAKCGKVGCSRLGSVLAIGRDGKPLLARKDYLFELLCERLTGQAADHFKSTAMEWGTEYEPLARTEYEARCALLVDEDGGRESDAVAGFWCSPDGLVGGDGGLEIKCPTTATHLETMLNGTIRQEYIYQMAGGCLIYGREWWDFVSFDPRLPENLQFFTQRFTREELPIQEVLDGVIKFLDELNKLEQKIREWK